MPDTPTPLDLDAIRADLDARVPARDLGDRNHARGLLAEVERLRAEVATERAEVTRLRTMVGDCHCDKNPETTNGPEDDCPQHGRPVAEVWDLVKRAEAGWDHARAEVDRLCAEARLANASAHSAGLAMGARLAHSAPAWDEDALGSLQALAVHWDAQAAHNADQGGDFWKGMVAKGRECADDLRRTLAVVRDRLPVKTSRDEVIAALHGLTYERFMSERVGDSARVDLRNLYGRQADKVLSLLPGRSEAEVKAESLREAADEWHAEHYGTRPAAYKFLWDRADRLTAEGCADRG